MFHFGPVNKFDNNSMMTAMDMTALGGLITICASALALIIKQLEGSKCKHIKCWGCECDRRLEAEKEEGENEGNIT
jgi:hypothetical protein